MKDRNSGARMRTRVPDIDDSIAQVVETCKAAVYAKDVDAFMQLYDSSTRVFDTWGVWSYEGAEAWRSAVEGWLTSLGEERVRVTFDDLKAIVTSDLSAVSAIVTYASVSAQGDQLRSMQNRLSWVLRNTGHVPRIVHEHTSAPAGFEDMKVILSR